MLSRTQQEYNELLKRIKNAECVLDNIDDIRANEKNPKSDKYYVDAFIKLSKLTGAKGLEVEKELGREMTYDERNNGF